MGESLGERVPQVEKRAFIKTEREENMQDGQKVVQGGRSQEAEAE